MNHVSKVFCAFSKVWQLVPPTGLRVLQIAPAMTLLHLGAGYGNGIANIHNAMKANAPMINVIGDHATYHRKFDAPLTCDLETLIKPHSKYIGVVESADIAGEIASSAFEAATNYPKAPVSIVLPADSAWNSATIEGKKVTTHIPSLIEGERIDDCALAIKNAAKPVILVGGDTLFDNGALQNMARLKAAGVRVLIDTFPARQKRGFGIFAPDKMQYFAEMALEDLKGVDLMVLAGTQAPVAFFAYPDKPSILVPDGCTTLQLTEKYENTIEALAGLVNAINAPPAPQIDAPKPIEKPSGRFNAFACAQSLARLMPENSVISDDAVTRACPIM